MVTIGSLQAGTKENVIPDEAIIKLNVRTFDEGVRKRVLAAIKRIVNAEAEASGAPKPPEITPLDRYRWSRNDAEATERVAEAFRAAFRRRPRRGDRADVGERGLRLLRRRVACAVGVLVRRRHRSRTSTRRRKPLGELNEIPTNHNPRFAPVIHPTLETGVETLVVAAKAWLSP